MYTVVHSEAIQVALLSDLDKQDLTASQLATYKPPIIYCIINKVLNHT